MESTSSNLLSSIKTLGLKVTDSKFRLKCSHLWDVSGQSLLKNAVEMYNLYVDGEIDNYTTICLSNGVRKCWLKDDEIFMEQIRIIKASLDLENEQKLEKEKLKREVKARIIKEKEEREEKEREARKVKESIKVEKEKKLKEKKKKVSFAPQISSVLGPKMVSQGTQTDDSEEKVLIVDVCSKGIQTEDCSSSCNSFDGMVPYRKPVVKDIHMYETPQVWVPKASQVQKEDVLSQSSSQFLKPRSSQKKKKKKRKVKNVWMPKVNVFQEVQKVQKVVAKSVGSFSQFRNSGRRWRNEKLFNGWFNVMFMGFLIPTKEPRRSVSSRSELGSCVQNISPKKWVS